MAIMDITDDQEIAIPGAEEQSRIGAFLVQLDEVVTLHQ